MPMNPDVKPGVKCEKCGAAVRQHSDNLTIWGCRSWQPEGETFTQSGPCRIAELEQELQRARRVGADAKQLAYDREQQRDQLTAVLARVEAAWLHIDDWMEHTVEHRLEGRRGDINNALSGQPKVVASGKVKALAYHGIQSTEDFASVSLHNLPAEYIGKTLRVIVIEEGE